MPSRFNPVGFLRQVTCRASGIAIDIFKNPRQVDKKVFANSAIGIYETQYLARTVLRCVIAQRSNRHAALLENSYAVAVPGLEELVGTVRRSIIDDGNIHSPAAFGSGHNTIQAGF
jgi:hypothetical protein